MRAEDVMTKDVVTVPPGTSTAQAWETMQRKGIHHLVVKTGSNVVGVVSSRDIGARRGALLRTQGTVADFMASSVVTVDRNATVRQIANVMRGRSIGSVVVTAGGRAVGIITVADLLEQIGRGGSKPAPLAERPGMQHRVPHRKRSPATGVW